MDLEEEFSYNCNITDTDDDNSISSEEDIASESDFEGRIRVRPIQEIWNGDEVLERLMSLNGSETIMEQMNDDNAALEQQQLDTLLLLACWMGNEKGVKFALECGQDPNIVDPEGR